MKCLHFKLVLPLYMGRPRRGAFPCAVREVAVCRWHTLRKQEQRPERSGDLADAVRARLRASAAAATCKAQSASYRFHLCPQNSMQMLEADL